MQEKLTIYRLEEGKTEDKRSIGQKVRFDGEAWILKLQSTGQL